MKNLFEIALPAYIDQKAKTLKKVEDETVRNNFIENNIIPQMQTIADFINNGVSSENEEEKQLALTMKENLVKMMGQPNWYLSLLKIGEIVVDRSKTVSDNIIFGIQREGKESYPSLAIIAGQMESENSMRVTLQRQQTTSNGGYEIFLNETRLHGGSEDNTESSLRIISSYIINKGDSFDKKFI